MRFIFSQFSTIKNNFYIDYLVKFFFSFLFFSFLARFNSQILLLFFNKFWKTIINRCFGSFTNLLIFLKNISYKNYIKFFSFFFVWCFFIYFLFFL